MSLDCTGRCMSAAQNVEEYGLEDILLTGVHRAMQVSSSSGKLTTTGWTYRHLGCTEQYRLAAYES